ncbi:MAG: RNA methyltransferase, partial [Mailhella sp.]|nr:RNA methyltransferase [Mailhella sp.]
MELLENDPERIDCVYVRKGRTGADSARLLDLCRDYGVRFSLVGDDAFPRLGRSVGHQGVCARLRETSFMPWERFLAEAASAPLPLIVALDQVQDPGNVGTLARTLYAMGAAGLVIPRHNSAFLGAGARRSAAGALERLPITQVVNLARAVEEARDAGFFTFAARKTDDSMDPLRDKLPLPALLVLGSEEKGIRP